MNNLSTEFAPRPDLKYPFERGWHPEPGEPFEVALGVFWLHVPMPISLDHINLWLLRDGDGWVIVDSGLDSPCCKEVWQKVFAGFLQGALVKRIIITHFHPDHIGLAAWLAHKFECKIWITEGEFRHYSEIIHADKKSHAKKALQFIAEIGFDSDVGDRYNNFFRNQCVYSLKMAMNYPSAIIIGALLWAMAIPQNTLVYIVKNFRQ